MSGDPLETLAAEAGHQHRQGAGSGLQGHEVGRSGRRSIGRSDDRELVGEDLQNHAEVLAEEGAATLEIHAERREFDRPVARRPGQRKDRPCVSWSTEAAALAVCKGWREGEDDGTGCQRDGAVVGAAIQPG